MRAIRLAAVCVAVLAATQQLKAGMILQPTAVTAPSESGSAVADNMINQSGLSVGYTSQVTNFDSFLASATHANSGTTVWANTPLVTFPVNLDFDLGGSFILESLGLWNWDISIVAGAAAKDFNLFAANDSSFTSATLLGSFTALESASNSAAAGQVFSFAPTSASFMRLEFLSNYGSPLQIAIGEVVFETSSGAAVPEPSSLALFGIGACVVGLGAARRRRNRRRHRGRR